MSAYSAAMGAWIPLMDYAMKKGVSLSTLRRYIKSKKIKYKTESGRYLVWDEDAAELMAADSTSEVAALKESLRRAQKEIAELKMLVALYEQKSAELS
jgi:predicted site-specific integrase-resolvase